MKSSEEKFNRETFAFMNSPGEMRNAASSQDEWWPMGSAPLRMESGCGPAPVAHRDPCREAVGHAPLKLQRVVLN